MNTKSSVRSISRNEAISSVRLAWSNAAPRRAQITKAVIAQFLPRYGHSAELLYVNETMRRHLVFYEDKLRELEVPTMDTYQLPTVIAYSASRNWLYVIEVVHKWEPISPIRLMEFQYLLKECPAEIVFVSAFLDCKTYRRFACDIAWDTVVWLAEFPDHLIHRNGDRFLGPYTA